MGEQRPYDLSSNSSRLAGGKQQETDCDPKDVARMVGDYVIEKKEDASSQLNLTSIMNHVVNRFWPADPSLFGYFPPNGAINPARDACY